MDFSASLAGLNILARFEHTGLNWGLGLNPSPCNRQFDFKRIDTVNISAFPLYHLKKKHVIR